MPKVTVFMKFNLTGQSKFYLAINLVPGSIGLYIVLLDKERFFHVKCNVKTQRSFMN